MEHNEELVKEFAHIYYLRTVERDAWNEEEGHTHDYYELVAEKMLTIIDEAGYVLRKKPMPRRKKK